MKLTCSLAVLTAHVAADPMAHLSGGLSHNVHRHEEECADGNKVDCQVEEGWAFGACSTTCGQGTATRSRAITVEVAPFARRLHS